jgi:hypothetical protein
MRTTRRLTIALIAAALAVLSTGFGSPDLKFQTPFSSPLLPFMSTV